MSRLRLNIKAPHGDVTLASFAAILSRASLILEDLDSAISENPKGELRWYIADLSVGSAAAVIESRPLRKEVVDPERLGTMVGANFVNGLDVIEHKAELPPYFTDQDVSRVRGIAYQLKRIGAAGLQAAQLNGGTEPIRETTLSEAARENVGKILRPQFKGIGSVVGKLEVISVHGGARFNVYDVLTKKAVSCRFDPERLEDVKEALGKRVSVTGIVYRNARGEPIRVERPEVRVLREEKDGPSVRDLIGLVPDMTGELSAEEYVRNLRNG